MGNVSMLELSISCQDMRLSWACRKQPRRLSVYVRAPRCWRLNRTLIDYDVSRPRFETCPGAKASGSYNHRTFCSAYCIFTRPTAAKEWCAAKACEICTTDVASGPSNASCRRRSVFNSPGYRPQLRKARCAPKELCEDYRGQGPSLPSCLYFSISVVKSHARVFAAAAAATAAATAAAAPSSFSL